MKTPYEIKQELELLDQIFTAATHLKAEAYQIKTQAILDSKQIKGVAAAEIKKELHTEHLEAMKKLTKKQEETEKQLRDTEKKSRELDAIIDATANDKVNRIIGSRIKDLDIRERKVEQREQDVSSVIEELTIHVELFEQHQQAFKQEMMDKKLAPHIIYGKMMARQAIIDIPGSPSKKELINKINSYRNFLQPETLNGDNTK